MKMHINTIKMIAKTATKHQLTAKALFILSLKAEEWIIERVKAAENLLEQRNTLRNNNGIPQKVRITDELLNEVLKCSKCHVCSAEQNSAGGEKAEQQPEVNKTGAGFVGSKDAYLEKGRCRP
jgi:hypothetical protein